MDPTGKSMAGAEAAVLGVYEKRLVPASVATSQCIPSLLRASQSSTYSERASTSLPLPSTCDG